MKITSFLHDNFVPHVPTKKAHTPSSPNTKVVSASSVAAYQDEEVGTNSKSLTQRGFNEKEKCTNLENDKASVYSTSSESLNDLSRNQLKRTLKGRHVQFLAISSTIGSALFVNIGLSLAAGGPLNLLLAFILWSFPILAITLSVAEEAIYLPIPSCFVRMAGRCCDTALEVTTAWNFWFLCCSQIPFEVVTVNSMIHFWRDDYSAAIPLVVQVILYFIINVFGVSIYGEVEFWLSLGKILLAVGLIIFTFVVMVGGNPQHDAFGFRYWNDPGVMNALYHTGDLGRFQGFLNCMFRAAFLMSGPEYLTILASEVGGDVRKTLKSAYLQVFVRLCIFFVGGALCVGILVPYNDKTLVETLGASKPGAAGSPYVIAMENLGINVLPHIVNVLIVTLAFSAGNSYVYSSSRTLYGFALDGFAPQIFTATTKTGIPLYCVLVSLCWSFLSFLQLGETASKVLNWIVNLITSCQLINFTILCFTYLFFYKALKAQGIDRRTLPFRGWGQPYTAFFGGISAFIMIFVSTYTVFVDWSVQTFLFLYLFIFIDIAIFIGYKLVRRTKWRKASEVDLVSGLREVEEHEEAYFESLLTKDQIDDEGHEKTSWYKRIMTFFFGSD